MKRKIIISLLVVLLISSVVYIVFLQNKNKDRNSYNKNAESSDNIVSKEREYDCTFTQTYHVVNLLDGYVAVVP